MHLEKSHAAIRISLERTDAIVRLDDVPSDVLEILAWIRPNPVFPAKSLDDV